MKNTPELLDTRPDLPPALRKVLATHSPTFVREVLASLPPCPANETAAESAAIRQLNELMDPTAACAPVVERSGSKLIFHMADKERTRAAAREFLLSPKPLR
ncbi:MAG: hypothetical protein QM784_00555 [Polyangiaceae bacterium]